MPCTRDTSEDKNVLPPSCIIECLNLLMFDGYHLEFVELMHA